MTQRTRIFRIVLKDLEGVPVVAVKSVLCTNPKIPFAVLKKGQTRVLGKSIFNRKVLELNDAAGRQVRVKICSRLCQMGGCADGKWQVEYHKNCKNENRNDTIHVGRRMGKCFTHSSIPLSKPDEVSDIFHWMEDKVHILSMPNRTLNISLGNGKSDYLCNLLQLHSSCFYACKTVNMVCASGKFGVVLPRIQHNSLLQSQHNHRLGQ